MAPPKLPPILDPVIISVAPPVGPWPEWLLRWENSTTSEAHVPAKGEMPASYKKVVLHDFTLFGKNFEEIKYQGFDSPFTSPAEPAKPIAQGKGKGVVEELKNLLVIAQRIAFSAFANRQLANGREVTQDAFKKWCNLSGPHKGWQPRDGKHRLGCAIDIDPLFNPYVATATDDRVLFGGEKPKGIGGPADLAVLDEKVRKPAIRGYDNAVQFAFGDPKAAVFPTKAGETSRAVARRFRRVSFAVGAYMDVGFPQPPSATKPPRAATLNRIPRGLFVAPREISDMAAQLRAYATTGLDPATVAKANSSSALTALRDQMVIDYDAFRAVLISGQWTFKNAKQSGFDVTRDPRFGFLNIQEDILVALLDTPGHVENEKDVRGLRWGAIDFGVPENGDMMHFDLGASRAQAVLDAAKEEPNPKIAGGPQVFFGVPQPPPEGK